MGQVQSKERVEDQGIMLRVRDGTSPVQGKSRRSRHHAKSERWDKSRKSRRSGQKSRDGTSQGIMLRVRDGTSPDQGKSRRSRHHAKSERWDKSRPRKE